MTIDELFEHHQALPAASGIVRELISSFEDEDVSFQEISKKIAADVSLTAKLLRLANSAHYHASRTISTVDQAVTMLGFITVRTLVISSSLTGNFKPIPGFNQEYFWRYSLHAAVVAKWLARRTHANLDLAFMTGLMHAIGELVMHIGMPQQCAALDNTTDFFDARRLEAEDSAFGFNYAKVGAELAKRWNFPAEFSEVLLGFPAPLPQSGNSTMCAIVHLGAWFARAQKNGLTVEEMSSQFPAEAGALIGLTFEDINDEMPSLDELSDGLDVLISG